MTVAEIKEKINRAIENSAGERKTTAVRYLLSVLHNIKSMLDQLDTETEWIRITEHGAVRFKCKKCEGVKTLAYDYCPDCGRRSTNNIISTVERYNPETGKYEKEKENE